jgi:hypothetical protein
VSLIGSHAFLGRGPEVPHRLVLRVDGEDVTDRHDLATMLSWPEPIAWNRVDDFGLFAASAVKNALALLGDDDVRTHVSGAEGLPGGYPARVGRGRVRLDLPRDIDRREAIAINERAAAWDGIEQIRDDGTVLYTEQARDAMAQLGYPYETVEFDRLAAQSEALSSLYERITTMEGTHA